MKRLALRAAAYIRGLFTRCDACSCYGAWRRRQNTSYNDDACNFATLCRVCQELNDEHWASMWADYYSGLL